MKTVGKRHSEDSIHKPFERLGSLLKKKNVRLASHAPVPLLKPLPRNYSTEDEQQLFRDAMADVTPLSWNRCSMMQQPAPSEIPVEECPSETLSRLRNLIRSGEGFIVSDTPEYMEGRGHQVSPLLLRRLRKGEFSVQDHTDLHGLNVFEARAVFDTFLKRAVSSGKRTVLIVHGRGLSSPVMPVLKTKVCHWLSTGIWRKWVIAFCSARSCDGGAGATYVLLRQRPVSKGQLRKKKGTAKIRS